MSRYLSRRAFLRGAGAATLALPVLESTRGTARAQRAPGTFFLLHAHGGTVSAMNRTPSMNDGRGAHHGLHWWHPLTSDETLRAINLGPLHQGLFDDLVSDLVLLRGIDNEAANAQAPYGGGGHRWVNVTHLTCADAYTEVRNGKTEPTAPNGPSFDKVLAGHLAGSAPFDAIDLGVRGHSYGTVQFLGDRQPASRERDPRAAFERLFAGLEADTPATPDVEATRRQLQRGSVLDGVLQAFNQLRGRVSRADQVLLEAHADHLRGIERRLDMLDAVRPPMCAPVELTGSADAEIAGPLMVDLAVQAARCALSPVISLQVEDVVTGWLGRPYGSDLAHSLGHAGREVGPTGPNARRRDDWEREMLANHRWRAGLFARLVRGLKETVTGTGTLLDESLCMYTSEFSNPAVHSARDLPFLLAGSLHGTFRTGRFVDFDTAPEGAYASRASTHNLYTTVLQSFGMDVDHFGGAHAAYEGPLAGLT